MAKEPMRQIPLWLYRELEQWVDGQPVPELEDHVRSVIRQKRDNDISHQFYSASKDPHRPEEDREVARQIYLDRKGVPESFRWRRNDNN